MYSVQPWIERDWSNFRPRQVAPVRHRLGVHPLLQMDSLLALAQRQEAVGQLHRIDAEATAGTQFVAQRADLDAMRRIGDAKGWSVLRYVQLDPEYRTLVDEVLDSIQPQVERSDPGMHCRAGFIFVSAQCAVTPFHIDAESNFLLQVQGRKTLYVWDPDDRVVVSEQALDRFHYDRDRELLRWRDEFRERAHVFALEPGQGAYMPSTSAHMVEAGDGLSVTMSFTYYTAASHRDARLHHMHYLARRAHIGLPAIGSHPWLDELSSGAIAALAGTQRIARRLAGHAMPSDTPLYAGTTH